MYPALSKRVRVGYTQVGYSYGKKVGYLHAKRWGKGIQLDTCIGRGQGRVPKWGIHITTTQEYGVQVGSLHENRYPSGYVYRKRLGKAPSGCVHCALVEVGYVQLGEVGICGWGKVSFYGERVAPYMHKWYALHQVGDIFLRTGICGYVFLKSSSLPLLTSHDVVWPKECCCCSG